MSNDRSNLANVVWTTLLVGTAAAVIGASVMTTRAMPAVASEAVSSSIEPSSHWVEKMKAEHRQFFDAPQPEGGMPLAHVYFYYETLNKAFSAKDADINAVLTFYGATTFYGLNDAAWAKYQIGEFLGLKDSDGKFVTANPWRANPTLLGMSMPQASLESLQKRGATLILCNNSLGIFSGMLAAKRGLDPKAVHDDMTLNMLPGVELIPGMVVAIEQAHKAGLSYHRQ